MEVQAATNVEATITPTNGQVPAVGIEPEVQETEGQRAEATNTNTDSGNQLDYSDAEATKAVVESLRKENAKLRTKTKERDSEFDTLNNRFSTMEKGLKNLFGDGEEGKNLSPEEKVEHLQARNEQLEMDAALKDAAFEYSIPAGQYEYFQFLVSKALNGLEEGQELTEDDLEDIAKQARGVGTSNNTSVEGQTGVNPPIVPDAGGITLDEFQLMGIVEKSKLYGQNPKLYEQLKIQEQAAKKNNR